MIRSICFILSIGLFFAGQANANLIIDNFSTLSTGPTVSYTVGTFSSDVTAPGGFASGSLYKGSFGVSPGGSFSVTYNNFDNSNSRLEDSLGLPTLPSYDLFVPINIIDGSWTVAVSTDTSVSESVTGLTTTGGFTNLTVNIADGMKFRDAKSLTLTFSTTDFGTDVSLEYGGSGNALSTVPEPTSVVMFGVAMLGLSRRRRN